MLSSYRIKGAITFIYALMVIYQTMSVYSCCFALVLDTFSLGKFEDLFLHYLF